MTGSALNVYHGGAPVRAPDRAREGGLCRRRTLFGCWACRSRSRPPAARCAPIPAAANSDSRAASSLTEAGHGHPLFAGKPAVFEAPTVHRDEIATLPRAPPCSRTTISDLQAAAFTQERGTFWGVQYHPSTTYADIGRRSGALRPRSWSRTACSTTAPRSRRSPPTCVPCRPIRAMRRCAGNMAWARAWPTRLCAAGNSQLAAEPSRAGAPRLKIAESSSNPRPARVNAAAAAPFHMPSIRNSNPT